jgi:1-deoxy-D-xylulose-5-phosphate synthase
LENRYKYLNNIDSPEDLKKLELKDLNHVCDELRSFIIESVSKNPGHFGASLGVVELTIALHYVFNTPDDKLIWDVGHQAYGHKIITGRRDKFHTNRKLGGISGFPKPDESEYDSFGVGHSSTSISAALGMAVAAKLKGENRKVVAVIGDGSLTGGMAFEGLNNVASTKSDVLIILNDNKIAIDESTGALREYLTDISTSKTYNRIKDDVWRFLGRIDRLGANVQGFTQKIDNALKSIILRNSNLFESLGIRYFGPVDGHDVVLLSRLFEDLKDIPGPKLLHIITKKGKGFKKAELDQTGWHAAPGVFDVKTGEIMKSVSSNCNTIKFQDVFGDAIIELAKLNKNIVAITPAMMSGCSLVEFNRQFPDRCFDVGIAEQHAVTFAAGLAKEGLIPFCNIYSSFSQRAYDQIIHDVALQKLPVIFCLDRGGLVGHDGATHHGSFDISFLRCIPDLVIAAPRDAEQLRNLMYTAQLDKTNIPFAIRYPRGNTIICNNNGQFRELEIGKGQCLKEGSDIAILTIGTSGNNALAAADYLIKDNINAAVYDMVFAKPIDEELLHDVSRRFDNIITIEDNSIIGGFGSAVAEFICENNYSSNLIRLGIPDKFIEHGTQEELIKLCEFDSSSIVNLIKKTCNRAVYRT